MRSVEEAAAGSIIAIEGTYVVVSFRYLTVELTIEVVPIDVLVARAVRDVGKVVAVELEAGIGLIGYIFGARFAYSQFALR